MKTKLSTVLFMALLGSPAQLFSQLTTAQCDSLLGPFFRVPENPDKIIQIGEFVRLNGPDDLSDLVVYPSIAKRARVEGTVVAEFIIDATGRADCIRILRGIGAGCDEALSKAIGQARFKAPHKLTPILFPYRFKLK